MTATELKNRITNGEQVLTDLREELRKVSSLPKPIQDGEYGFFSGKPQPSYSGEMQARIFQASDGKVASYYFTGQKAAKVYHDSNDPDIRSGVVVLGTVADLVREKCAEYEARRVAQLTKENPT